MAPLAYQLGPEVLNLGLQGPDWLLGVSLGMIPDGEPDLQADPVAPARAPGL